MSLVVNLESLQGLGAVGDRVARVIFRGNEGDVTLECLMFMNSLIKFIRGQQSVTDFRTN